MDTDSTNHDQPPTSSETSIAKRLRSHSMNTHKSGEDDVQQLLRKSDKNPSSRKPSHEKPTKQELHKKIKQNKKMNPKTELNEEDQAAQDAAMIMASQEAALRSYQSAPAMSTEAILNCTGQVPGVTTTGASAG